MSTLVFFLEEPSAQEMLQGLLPRILPTHVIPRFIVFQGKQDLERNLIRRLRGWQMPDSMFVVMRDQDAGDCLLIKQRLVDLCKQAGRGNVLVRVACRELESFYLGDLQAVEQGLGLSGIALHQRKRKYRTPDALGNPAEELTRLTGGIYQKVAGSRAIGPHLDLLANKSHSFNILLAGIRNIVGERV